jgi:hypothetical protein
MPPKSPDSQKTGTARGTDAPAGVAQRPRTRGRPPRPGLPGSEAKEVRGYPVIRDPRAMAFTRKCGAAPVMWRSLV